MAPCSLACAKDAFLRSVLFRLAPVRSAPVSLARVSLARCSTAPDKSPPDKSASDRSFRLSGARGNEQFGHDFDLPERKSPSPAAQDFVDNCVDAIPASRPSPRADTKADA